MKRIVAALLCLLVCELAYAQTELTVKDEGITINNLGNKVPEASSVLDVGSQSKGVIFPRLSLSEIFLLITGGNGKYYLPVIKQIPKQCFLICTLISFWRK